ncbi:MAG: TolC family protein [Marinifilaceae bacterium]
MNRFIISMLICFCCLYEQSSAQKQVRAITLSDALTIAQEQSLEALEAQNFLRIAYWEYRSYRADMLPNIVLKGILPTMNKSLSTYQKEDGSLHFIPNRSLSEDLSIDITQNIPQTGGTVSIQTQLQRTDQLGQGNNAPNYLSIPVALTLSQPMLSFNPLKWERRIQPLKYTAAKKQFVVDMEGIAVKTVQYFFNLLLCQVNKNIAFQNLENSKALYEIAEGKRKLGLISENDLQQLKVGFLNASASVVVVEQDFERKMYTLRNFLGYDDNIQLIPEVPNEISYSFHCDYQQIMDIVNRNNPFTENIKTRLIESEKVIAKAKSERGFRLDVNASIGFTGTDIALPNAYQNLENRQMINVSVRVPILDWGKGKGKVKLSQSRQEIEKNRIERETLDLEQNVEMLIRQINDQSQLTNLFRQADSLARNRYKIAFETFVMGKINVLDINAAQNEQNQAQRNYIAQIYNSWLYYYSLRQITLYDFQKQQDIINDLNEFVWTEKFLRK